MSSFSKSPLIKVIKRELTSIYKSKVLLFASIIGPLLSLALVALIFSAGVVRNIPVAIVDNDNSQLSAKVSQQIDAAPVANVRLIKDISIAHREMRQGKISAIIVIPSNFERHIVRMESPEIALYVNNANVIKGGMLYSGIYKTLATISAGVKVSINMKSGATLNQAIQNAQPVRVDSHLLFNPYGNYSYFLTLSLSPLMMVIFVFLVTVYTLGLELKTGTAKQYLETANNSIIVALSGKIIPYTFLFMMNMMVMNLLLFKVLGTPLTGSIIVILFAEFLIIVIYQLLAIALLSITSNMRLTLSLGSAYTLMAMTFAGITFPIFAMPLIARIFSWFFPYTFWIKIFVGQTIKSQPLFASIPDFLILTLYILIPLLSFKTMKRKLSNSKYWGRS